MTLIKGTVRDLESGHPICGVKVQGVGEAKNTFCFTDSEGAWELFFETLDFCVSISHKDYITKIKSVSNYEQVFLLALGVLAYANKDSCYAGESIKLYVHSAKRFSARLIRYGSELENVLKIGQFDPHIQNYSTANFFENGLDWVETMEVGIPESLSSGLYGVQLSGKDVNDAIIPIIVKPTQDSRANPIMVVGNTFTWHANNTFGGKSRYRDFTLSQKIDESIFLQFKRVAKRIVKFFFKTSNPKSLPKSLIYSRSRPLVGMGLNNMGKPYEPYQSHLAGGEWRLLAWLEKNDIIFDYYADYDLEASPAILKKYSTVILNTHSKYWGENAAIALLNLHRNSKLNVLNFGGNAIFNFIKPLGDGRFLIKDNSINAYYDGHGFFGVSFNLNSYSTCAPYKIVSINHPVFKGILEDSLGTQSLLDPNLKKFVSLESGRIDLGMPNSKYFLQGTGASGWEVDCGVFPNKEKIQLIACGKNQNGGAHMTFKDKMNNSGLMFSASSVAFTGSILVDPGISKLVKNIMHKCE